MYAKRIRDRRSESEGDYEAPKLTHVKLPPTALMALQSIGFSRGYFILLLENPELVRQVCIYGFFK